MWYQTHISKCSDDMCVTSEWHASQSKHKPEPKNENIRERWDNTIWRNFFKRAVTCLCAVLEKMMNTARSISINSTFERLNGMHIYINGDNWLLWILSTIRSKTKIISARRVAYCRRRSSAFPRNETLQHGVSLMSLMSWPLRQHTIFPASRPSLPGFVSLKFSKPNERRSR